MHTKAMFAGACPLVIMVCEGGSAMIASEFHSGVTTGGQHDSARSVDTDDKCNQQLANAVIAAGQVITIKKLVK